MPPATLTSCFFVKLAETGEYSLVASRDITAGTTVLAETPLFALEDSTPLNIVLQYRKLDAAQVRQYNQLKSGGLLEPTAEEVQKLRDLPANPWIKSYTNEAGDEPKTRIDLYTRVFSSAGAQSVAIFMNNAFDMRNPEGTPDQRGVFLHAARLQHSCTPNCYASWDAKSGELRVRTVHQVMKAEQLRIAYGAYKGVLLLSHDERDALLRSKYDVQCTCYICNTPANVRRAREELAQVVAEIDPVTGGSEETYVKLLKMMTTERLDAEDKAEIHLKLASLYEHGKQYENACGQVESAYAIACTCLGQNYADTITLREEYNRINALLSTDPALPE